MLLTRYRKSVSKGELRADPAQDKAVHKLQDLARGIAEKPAFSLFRWAAPPYCRAGRCRMIPPSGRRRVQERVGEKKGCVRGSYVN